MVVINFCNKKYQHALDNGRKQLHSLHTIEPHNLQ